MYKNNKVTCIIPAFNEGPRIGKSLSEILDVSTFDEVVVINDGSSDNTLEEIEKFKENPKLKIITYSENKGKGYALAEGIESASNEILFLIDADMFGFHDVQVEKVLENLIDKENDLVIASPYEMSSVVSAVRSLTMPLAFSLMGIRAMRKNDLVSILDEIRSTQYGVDVLVYANFVKKNKRVKQILLKGIKTPYKTEKESSLEGNVFKAFVKGTYRDILMMRDVVQASVKYPPIPTLEEFTELIKRAIKKDLRRDEIFDLIDEESKRQIEGLELIPSENYVSTNVLTALGSILTNKYSEGYPGKRYYGGNKYIDLVENTARKRALKVFGLDEDEWGVNVQPYSGSPANQAVYVALLEPGDTFMGLALPSGGHLTHGWKVNFSAKFFNSVQYTVSPDGEFDYDEILKVAKEKKPKLIWVGATAYVRNYNYEKFSKIAKEVGAYLVADIAHVAGLIAAGVHNSPFPYADVVTTTTHKTLRGPRGAMIFARKELIEKIDKAVFPGIQGGPHNHQTAAIAVALGEALMPEFKNYGAQIVKNTKALAEALEKRGIKLAGGKPENHMMLLDFSSFGGGSQVEAALELANITVNKNTIPNDPNPPYYPSGIRLGTPALTSRGMVEKDMEFVAEVISRVVDVAKNYPLPKDKMARADFIGQLKKDLATNKEIMQIRKEVKSFASKFPIPGITE